MVMAFLAWSRRGAHHMSSPSSHVDIGSDTADGARDDRWLDSVSTACRRFAHPVRAVGFWSAIALPFLYVPLLATGLATTAELMVFMSLLAANVVAIALGHSHTPN